MPQGTSKFPGVGGNLSIAAMMTFEWVAPLARRPPDEPTKGGEGVPSGLSTGDPYPLTKKAASREWEIRTPTGRYTAGSVAKRRDWGEHPWLGGRCGPPSSLAAHPKASG
jgi:hypothetical protein